MVKLSTALANVGPLSAALALATEAGDMEGMKDIRALATAMQQGARARMMGVEAENAAAEVVLRAERAIGHLLIRMTEDGTRAKGGGEVLRDDVQLATGRGSQSALRGRGPSELPTLASMGITNARAAWEWQQVARLDDGAFEAMLEAARGHHERIAKWNFYRKGKSPLDAGRARPTREDADFLTFRQGAYGLLGWATNGDGTGAPTRNGLLTLPNDELVQVAVLIRALARAYQDAQATRVSS